MAGAGNEVSPAEQEDEIGKDEQCSAKFRRFRNFAGCEISQVVKTRESIKSLKKLQVKKPK